MFRMLFDMAAVHPGVSASGGYGSRFSSVVIDKVSISGTGVF